jgi:SrtB family sortase
MMAAVKRPAAGFLAAALLFSVGCSQSNSPERDLPDSQSPSQSVSQPQEPQTSSSSAASSAETSKAGSSQSQFQLSSPSASREAVPAEAASEEAPPEEDPFDDEEVIREDTETSAVSETDSPESSSGSSTPYVVYEDGRNRADIKEDMLEGIQEWKAINSDTVGWLFVPHTTLDSPVLQTTDNTYYLKHNEYKVQDVNGALVSDYRNHFGGRENQSKNIVLYGHSKDENPDGGVEASREYEHFTELKRYQDISFCRENPYVMFAADGDPMVWEIFAVFHTRTDFYYIQPNPTDSQFLDIVEEARYKSLFNFPDVEVTEDDKILTLSTCCRRIVPTYPNGYRFVIMAKLVDKGAPLLRTANVEENPTGLSPWNVY